MKCPKCGKAIAFEATSHDSCGWTVHAGGAAGNQVQCSFEGCNTPARYNVERPEGRADVCHEHYLRLAQLDAARYCAEHGIQTREQAQAWLRRLPPGRFSTAVPEREPGQDDEEREVSADQRE